jgi:PTS system nitrogen regulatory IIA component
VASYLKLTEKTVLRMVHRQEIPCAKVGSQWRFVRSLIDDWLLSRMQVLPGNDLNRLIEQEGTAVPLSRLLREDMVRLDIWPGNKRRVLEQLVQPLEAAGLVADVGEFLGKLLERERIMPTTVGKGVAIPHLRNPRENPSCGPLLVVGVCPEGTDFGAQDGSATHLFFLLCTDSEVVHLKVLSRLTRMLHMESLVAELLRARDARDVVRLFIRADQLITQERNSP